MIKERKKMEDRRKEDGEERGVKKRERKGEGKMGSN